MFASTFVVALVGASAASAASVVTRTTGSTYAVPSTYTQPWLEPYQDYHTRYLALKCDEKHDTKFFDACCHPMLKWETLAKARPAYCVPSASTAVASPTTHVQIVSHSASAATATASAASDDGEDCDEEDDDDEEDCDDEDDNTGDANNTGATSTNNNSGDDEEECEEGEEDCVCEDEPETSTAAVSSSTSKAASSTKTRSTVFVTSTFTAASTSIATSSPAVTSTASSTVKTSSSSTKESSSSASATSSTESSSTVESTTSATSTKATSTKTTQSSTSTTQKASSTPDVPLTKQDTGSYSGGFGTFYLQGGVAGACGNTHDDNALIAAIDFRRYGNLGAVSPLCGHKLKVTNDKNGKSVVVNIQDACPTCTNANSVDLSKGAFLQIATEEEGEVPISVTFV